MTNDVKAANAERQRKYRANHRRIEYVPSEEALAAIEKHKALNNCRAGVLDVLILAGSAAIISGNAERQGCGKV